MAVDYATSADLKSALSLTGETFADAEIALALTAASRGIEQSTNRRFWVDAVDAQRYYTPEAADVLFIDDLVTLTTLEISSNGNNVFDQTWVVNTEFTLEPLNAAGEDPARPFTIIRPNLLGPRFFWPYPRSVRVTGKFGWPTVPSQIKEATIMLAAKLLRRVREAPFGVVAFGIDGGAVTIARNDPDIQFLIGPLTKLTV